jgi:hypothetical protein
VLDLIILLVVTHKRYDVLSFGSNKFIGIDARRIKDKYDKSASGLIEDIYSSNKKHVQAAYKLGNIRTILVDQGEAFYKYTDKLIDYIVSLSKKYDGFYLKQHPTLKTKNSLLITNLIQISSEIPVELIITDNSVILGLASNSMRDAGMAISMLELVDIDNSNKVKYLEFLNNSNVLIPKTISEFQEQLNLFLKT